MISCEVVGCWNFAFWQHVRSHKEGSRLVTVRTNGAFYNVASWRCQAFSTMTQYPTQSHYPDTELPSPSPALPY